MLDIRFLTARDILILKYFEIIRQADTANFFCPSVDSLALACSQYDRGICVVLQTKKLNELVLLSYVQ